MEIPIPACPPVPPSLCLPGFSTHSYFHCCASCRLCPPGLPVCFIWTCPDPQVLHQSLCFTPFLSASTCNSPHNFLSLLFPRHILLTPPAVAHISVSFRSTGSSPFGSLYNLSIPSLLLAPVPNFNLFQFTIS